MRYATEAHADYRDLRVFGPPRRVQDGQCSSRELLNEELFDTLDDSRRKLALWRYDYNNVRPHSSLGNKTPAEARRALEQCEGSARAALAQIDDKEYEIQIRKLSL